MKGFKLLSVGLLLMALVGSPSSLSIAEETTNVYDLTYIASEDGAAISFVKIDGGRMALFLPSSANLSALALHFEGGDATVVVDEQSLDIASDEPFDLASLFPDPPADGIYSFILVQGPHRLSVKLMISANIGSLYITSDDPANEGQAFVDQVKGNKASGKMVLLRADGSTVYAGDLKQIKGRGNTTWNYPKKPYQIKLTEKIDLLETGDPTEAEKTWILLANYYDHSLIRNALTFDLAAELGMPYSPHSQSVDFYYDGQYRGTYLLCEKTEISSGRVGIHDLEKDFETANPQVEDFDGLPTDVATNAYGRKCYYVTGLNDPDDISGGYLLEMDFWERADVEKSHFNSRWQFDIVVKSPEYLSLSALSYISEFYQDFEDALFREGVHPETGKSYTDYVDLTSLARSYVIFELSQNGDAYRSSTFFYKPAGEEMLYAGPVWDYDTAYGLYYLNYRETEMVAARTRMGKALIAVPSFLQAVQDIYRNELNPLVTDIVLSDDPQAQSGRLRSIAGYSEELAASRRMNAFRWPQKRSADDEEQEEEEDPIEFLQGFIARRNEFLNALQWEEIDAVLEQQQADSENT